jgi:predicted protein tyrosine phosphatase
MSSLDNVAAILMFGNDISVAADRGSGHFLVHCHQGISRSTAAMLAIILQMSQAERRGYGARAPARDLF